MERLFWSAITCMLLVATVRDGECQQPATVPVPNTGAFAYDVDFASTTQACASPIAVAVTKQSFWTSMPTMRCAASLWFPTGTGIALRPGNAQTLTLSGATQAAPGQKIFDYTLGGKIVLTGAAKQTLTFEMGGARGDGATNDSLAANGIIATANASGGLPIELGAKNYRVNSAASGVILNILNGQVGMTIRGQGSNLTTISTTTAGADLMAAISVSGGNATYNLSGFTLKGPDTVTGSPVCAGTTGSRNGLEISGETTAIFNLKDLNAIGFCGVGSAAFKLDNFENGVLDNLQSNFNQTNFFISRAAANTFNFLSAGKAHTYGVELTSSSSNVFNNPTVQSNDGLGWFMSGGAGGLVANTINGLHCENNNVLGLAAAGCVLMDSTTNIIQGNICIGCSMNGPHENWEMAQAVHPLQANIWIGGISNSGAAGPKIIERGAVVANVFIGFITSRTDVSRTGANFDVYCAPPTGNVNQQPGCQENAHTLNAVPFETISQWGRVDTGTLAFITDGSTNEWGARVTGGGTNKVLVVFNGSGWTVVGK